MGVATADPLFSSSSGFERTSIILNAELFVSRSKFFGRREVNGKYLGSPIQCARKQLGG
jgi:hypothetical protein